MTACRPTHPRPYCYDCARTSLPIQHKGKNGIVIADVVIDPTAILRRDRRCALFVERVAS